MAFVGAICKFQNYTLNKRAMETFAQLRRRTERILLPVGFYMLLISANFHRVNEVITLGDFVTLLTELKPSRNHNMQIPLVIPTSHPKVGAMLLRELMANIEEARPPLHGITGPAQIEVIDLLTQIAQQLEQSYFAMNIGKSQKHGLYTSVGRFCGFAKPLSDHVLRVNGKVNITFALTEDGLNLSSP